jgi:hypothetical protein
VVRKASIFLSVCGAVSEKRNIWRQLADREVAWYNRWLAFLLRQVLENNRVIVLST